MRGQARSGGVVGSFGNLVACTWQSHPAVTHIQSVGQLVEKSRGVEQIRPPLKGLVSSRRERAAPASRVELEMQHRIVVHLSDRRNLLTRLHLRTGPKRRHRGRIDFAIPGHTRSVSNRDRRRPPEEVRQVLLYNSVVDGEDRSPFGRDQIATRMKPALGPLGPKMAMVASAWVIVESWNKRQGKWHDCPPLGSATRKTCSPQVHAELSDRAAKKLPKKISCTERNGWCDDRMVGTGATRSTGGSGGSNSGDAGTPACACVMHERGGIHWQTETINCGAIVETIAALTIDYCTGY